MKKLVYFICLGFVVLAFSACSSRYAITYATNPSGANIVCNGVGEGFSPLTLYYDKKGIKDDGILVTQPCKAIFVSGYVDYFSSIWDTKKFPDGVKQTLTRPQGEGYAQDMAFSMEYEHRKMVTEAMQKQARAASRAADAAESQAIQTQQSNQQRNLQLQQMNNNLFQMNQKLRGW